ncbi:hypothetical protein A9Q83_06415 [Alphaproteobacteria bacterium 46_93_T64]|nr:hypothetical protein A9Q83_06415 [Alphaproteobacteria bacterium 46_93_T64]
MTESSVLNNAKIANSIYTLLRAGNTAKATTACKKALQQSPNSPHLLDAMGMVHANELDLQNAETCFRTALKISPENTNALNNLGNILRETNMFEDAIHQYENLVKLLPLEATPRTNLGKALLGNGQSSSAIIEFEHALTLDPAYTQARMALAKILSETGDISEAIIQLEEGSQINPKDIDLHKLHSQLLAQSGDVKQAIKLLKQASKLAPNDFEIWFTLGNQLTDQLKFKDAENALQEALKLAHKKSEVHNSFGILFKNQEKPEIAADHYSISLELDETNAKAHNNLGNALIDLERKEDALHHFNRAIELEPDFDEAYINRVQALELSPDHPELKRLIGYLSSDRLPKETKTNLLFTLGKTHDELGLYKEAYKYTQLGNRILAENEKFDRARHYHAIASVISSFAKPAICATGKNADDPIPIFIIGMTRSGKTLTESILANHPDVYAGGERHDWQDTVKSTRGELGLTQPFPAFIDHLTARQIQLIGEKYIDAIKKEANGARYFIDTMPANFPYIGLMFKALPKVKIITCQRHLLDNCLYAYFQRYKHANSYSYDLRDAAAFFADYNRMLAHWGQLYGDRILSQTYESLVQNPEKATEKLFKYCDLEFSENWVPEHLNSQEIGRWHNYTDQLVPLVNWLNQQTKYSQPQT